MEFLKCQLLRGISIFLYIGDRDTIIDLTDNFNFYIATEYSINNPDGVLYNDKLIISNGIKYNIKKFHLNSQKEFIFQTEDDVINIITKKTYEENILFKKLTTSSFVVAPSSNIYQFVFLSSIVNQIEFLNHGLIIKNSFDNQMLVEYEAPNKIIWVKKIINVIDFISVENHVYIHYRGQKKNKIKIFGSCIQDFAIDNFWIINSDVFYQIGNNYHNKLTVTDDLPNEIQKHPLFIKELNNKLYYFGTSPNLVPSLMPTQREGLSEVTNSICSYYYHLTEKHKIESNENFIYYWLDDENDKTIRNNKLTIFLKNKMISEILHYQSFFVNKYCDDIVLKILIKIKSIIHDNDNIYIIDDSGVIIIKITDSIKLNRYP